MIKEEISDQVTLFIPYLLLAVFSFSVKLNSFSLALKMDLYAKGGAFNQNKIFLYK